MTVCEDSKSFERIDHRTDSDRDASTDFKIFAASLFRERLQEYFILIAYDIKEGTDNAAKRRAILLTSIGSGAYRVLKDLSFPAAPNTKTFDQLATLLRGHYKPTRVKVAERYRFHSASQRPGQSITDFVRELKSLAGTCEFTNEQLGDSLRDRFI